MKRGVGEPTLAQPRPVLWVWFSAAAMVAMSLAQSIQNYFVVPKFGWVSLFVFELPVWFCWMATFPAVFAVARRFPLAGANWKRHLPVHLVACALASIAQLTMANLVRAGFAWIAINANFSMNDVNRASNEFTLRLSESTPYIIGRYFAFPMLLYFMAVALHHAMTYYRAFDLNRIRQSELESLLARSQLDALKLQLQPHFLFNTLNTVSSLVTRDPVVARRMVIRLSDLLRYALREDGGHEATLSDELEFLRGYVDIQTARFRDRLEVKFQIDPATSAVIVPRMLLQPILENAVQHGFPNDGPAIIVVDARLAGGRLRLAVTDNGPGFDKGKTSRSGIGLKNTRERLARLYGDSAVLMVASSTQGGASVTIEMPARSIEARSRA